MTYAYTAVTKDGKTIQGTVQADSKSGVIAVLGRQGARPLTIKEKSDKSSKSRRKKKVKLKDLVIFTRQLSTMVSAGVPLTRSLATLQEQAPDKYFSEVLSGIMKDVEGGQSLGSAFAKYPHIFSDVYVNMVYAGEAGGILDEILKRLAAQVEQDSSMRKKIKSAMTYPAVILFITIVAFFGIMLVVVPKLGEIIMELGGPDAELPAHTQAMLGLSDFMINNALLIVVGVVVSLFFIRKYIRTPSGKYKLHSLLLRLPIIKVLIVKVAVARFARTFASLMSAGVGVLESLEVTGGAIGNKVIEAELKEASKQVKNGKQLSEPLSRGTHFPPIVAQMLSVGEETGQIDTILIKVADFYEEEVQNTIESISSIIEPVMIVVMGGMVGLIAASVMGPIASLSQNIGG